MNLEQLAQSLIDGSISLTQWQLVMREYIRIVNTNAAAIACGGWENVTQSMWGFVGSLIKKQYAWLENFAMDIAMHPEQWLNGRLLVRMEMYGKAEWGTFEAVLLRLAMDKGMTKERAVLGYAEHCSDCLARAKIGWAPIGSLPRIGDSRCLTNCRCMMEYAL